MYLSRTIKPSSCLRCYYYPLDKRIAITVCRHCLISKWNLFRIDHFRVASSLCFKARLSAKPLIWKWFFILMHLKLVFSNKCFALSLVLKVRRRGLINRENETIITIEAFWILVLWQLHVNSYGNTQIWYPASFIVDNLFVGIGYFFIYLPWTVAFFVFAWMFFFSFLQLDLLLIYFWGGNAVLHLEP